MIGDTVNTAARLQGLTRVLNTPLVVGDAVVAAIRALPRANGEDPLARLHDGGEHTLRGRAGPVRIWTYEPAPAAASEGLPSRALSGVGRNRIEHAGHCLGRRPKQSAVARGQGASPFRIGRWIVLAADWFAPICRDRFPQESAPWPAGEPADDADRADFRRTLFNRARG